MEKTNLFRRFVAILIVVLAGYPVVAEPYRVIAGDRLQLEFASGGEPQILPVDIDGQVRIAGLGGVAVGGLTLDGAESRLEQMMRERGLFVDPQVSLSVLDYAPILVTGDVMQPGRFAYLPGMTVASALALAGGSRADGLSRPELTRLRSDAEAGLDRANLDSAAAAVRIARLEAQLAGAEAPLTLRDDLRAQIPLPQRVNLAGMMQDAATVLRNQRDRAWKLTVFWENELAAIAVQRETLTRRIAVQTETLDSAEKALMTAQNLNDRGLQTATRLAAAAQREAEARGRLLELRSARLAAARAVSDAERQRVLFLSGQDEAALTGLAEARLDLAAAAMRYRRNAGLLAALSGGSSPMMEVMVIAYDLQSPRANRPAGRDITPDTRLLPGETLIVSVVPPRTDADG